MTATTTDTPSTNQAQQPQSPDLHRLVFADAEFDGQFLRALDTIGDGGADVGECFVTARGIPEGDHDAWYQHWTALGDRVSALADASLSAGRTVSARNGYLRATTYYRTAGVFLYRPPLDPRLTDSYRRQRAAFQAGAALLDCTFEVVQVSYQDTTLEAYFLTPGGAGPFPVLCLVGGYDGTKEESYFAGGRAALDRGYAVLLIDGPGQGGALVEQGLVFRPDWEAVVTPQIEWLLARPEVRADQIALLGRSWGGYLAPRAVTAEHRVAAVIADAAQYTPGPHAARMLPQQYRDQFDTGDPELLNDVLEQRMRVMPQLRFTIERGMLTHGVATPLDYLRAAAPYTIAPAVGSISCPVLVCEAENDVRSGDAKPLYDALTGAKEYIRFRNADGAGEHDEAGAAALFATRAFDWLDGVLAR